MRDFCGCEFHKKSNSQTYSYRCFFYFFFFFRQHLFFFSFASQAHSSEIFLLNFSFLFFHLNSLFLFERQFGESVNHSGRMTTPRPFKLPLTFKETPSAKPSWSSSSNTFSLSLSLSSLARMLVSNWRECVKCWEWSQSALSHFHKREDGFFKMKLTCCSLERRRKKEREERDKRSFHSIFFTVLLSMLPFWKKISPQNEKRVKNLHEELLESPRM